MAFAQLMDASFRFVLPKYWGRGHGGGHFCRHLLLKLLLGDNRLLMSHLAILQFSIVSLFILIVLLQGLQRGPDFNQVLKHLGMPRTRKIVCEHPISFILFTIAFESVESPVSPIEISLSNESHQVLPRDVLLVVSELAEQVWVPQAPHVCLGVEESFLEIVVGVDIP